MLREALSQIDADALLKEGRELAENPTAFSIQANRALAEGPGLKSFFDIAEMMVGERVQTGAGAMLLFLKKNEKLSGWVERAVKSFSREFCMEVADVLVKEGGKGAGLKFTKVTSAMLEEDYPQLGSALVMLSIYFGLGFYVGAYLQLELIRRQEEGNFGALPKNARPQ